jgi:hypothetical protein
VETPQPSPTVQPVMWVSPLLGIIKVNWDVVLDKKLRRVGFWIIARDNEGNLLAARSTTHIDTTMAEV